MGGGGVVVFVFRVILIIQDWFNDLAKKEKSLKLQGSPK